MLTQGQLHPQQSTPLASTSKPSKPWLANHTPTVKAAASSPTKHRTRTAAKQHPLYQTPATSKQQHTAVRRTRLAQSRPALSGGLQALFATPEPAAAATPCATSHAPPATSPPPLALERTPMSPQTMPRRSISSFIQQLPATTITPPSDGKTRRARSTAGLAAQLQVLLSTCDHIAHHIATTCRRWWSVTVRDPAVTLCGWW